MINSVTQAMRDMAMLHYQGTQAIADRKLANLQRQLGRMTLDQRRWWFGAVDVQSLSDLDRVKQNTGDHVLASQEQNPPYGIFESGEVLVTSSGSSGTKKLFPYSMENWLRYCVNASRCLISHGVDSTDRVLTCDVGSTQAGYRCIEDAAQWICGSQVVIDRSVSLSSKLEMIGKHRISVFVSNSKKLLRMIELEPRRYFKHRLKLLIATGMTLEEKQRIAEAFGVEAVVDMYGTVEIGNQYFTCSHGHRHVHEDLFHSVQRGNESLFSNLQSNLVWNYTIPQEQLIYSDKGKCECGSYLPTVDHFVPNSADRSMKG